MEKKQDPVPIRLTETVEAQAKRYCALHDIGFSTWVSSLIVAALDDARREYERLHSIFGEPNE